MSSSPGPTAGAPVVHGPPQPVMAEEPARGPAEPSASSTGTATSGRGSAAAGSSTRGTGSGTAPARTAQASPTTSLPASLVSGTVARVSGLKAAQDLNGELCQLLRAADTAPDRVVVRTRHGEKSLKPSNLAFGASVFPRLVLPAAAVLVALSLAFAADALAGSRQPFSLAAIPVLAMSWLLGTVGLCLWLYQPCKTAEVWVPSISELGMHSPLRHAYRVGFLLVGLLLASSIWLYSELLMPCLDEAPQMLPAGLSLGHQLENSTEEGVAREDLDSESTAMAGDPEVVNATNATNITNSTFLIWAPNRSVFWGYVAAAGVGVQGLITFDGRVSIRSAVHLAGMAAFVGGTIQHSLLSTAVLLSVRGRTLAAQSSTLKAVLRLRRNITDYGPIALLGVPVCSQYMNMQKPMRNPREPMKAMNILKDSGIIKQVGILQWALVAIYVTFYSTFAVDYWFASKMLSGVAT